MASRWQRVEVRLTPAQVLRMERLGVPIERNASTRKIVVSQSHKQSHFGGT
jgi:hypothetical protein